MAGDLYCVLVINAMGPATDPKHPDLLTTWDEVDRYVSTLCSPGFRERYPDSAGERLVVSWFVVSWSGFRTNPVRRDFGTHTIYDHYVRTWGDKLRTFGDGIYWMYNHPAPSGVGNEWGTDWRHNTQYYNILNRLLIDRSYFPSVCQIPTENNDASAWLEKWIPFDFSSRAAKSSDLGTIEADGRRSRDIMDWTRAPDNWDMYRPSPVDYQVPGGMQRWVFRCLDLKTRIHTLSRGEVCEAFERARGGRPTVLAVYEHDFRDRASVIEELFLKVVADVAREFADVRWRYANALTAAQEALELPRRAGPRLEASLLGNRVRVAIDRAVFGGQPYCAIKETSLDRYLHVPLRVVGDRIFEFDLSEPARNFTLGLAASDPAGNVGVSRYRYRSDLLEVDALQPLQDGIPIVSAGEC